MFVGIMSTFAKDTNFKHDGLWYTVTSEENLQVVLSGYDSSVTGDLVIPEEVTNNGSTYTVIAIGDYALNSCRSVTSVVIPGSVVKIGDGAFQGCLGMTSVSLPESITVIGSGAFYCCYGLISVTLPKSLTKIGIRAFYYCKALTSVVIPGSVTEIGEGAFSDCENLIEILVDDNNQCYSSIDGVLFNKEITALVQCPASKSGEYIVPVSVIEIDAVAFSNCIGLTSVILPESLTEIGRSAFYYCI